MSSTSQLMPKSVFIYGLCDPSNGQLRYVGKSKNPTARRYQHVCASQLVSKTHKNNWIKALLANGEKPDQFIIEEVSRVLKNTRTVGCVSCGDEFSAVDVKAQYCSGTCRQRAYRRQRSLENVDH